MLKNDQNFFKRACLFIRDTRVVVRPFQFKFLLIFNSIFGRHARATDSLKNKSPNYPALSSFNEFSETFGWQTELVYLSKTMSSTFRLHPFDNSQFTISLSLQQCHPSNSSGKFKMGEPYHFLRNPLKELYFRFKIFGNCRGILFRVSMSFPKELQNTMLAITRVVLYSSA